MSIILVSQKHHNSTCPKETQVFTGLRVAPALANATAVLPDTQSRNMGVITRNSLFPTWHSKSYKSKYLNLYRIPSFPPSPLPPPHFRLQLLHTWACWNNHRVCPNPLVPSEACCWWWTSKSSCCCHLKPIALGWNLSQDLDPLHHLMWCILFSLPTHHGPH